MLASRFDPTAMAYLDTLEPRLEFAGVLCTHGMPSWDASDPVIFYTGEGPWHDGAVATVFSTYSHWLFLIGHFHRWFAASEGESSSWDGSTSLELKSRHFVVINAVYKGSCAVLDTDNRTLTPYRIG